MSFTEVLAELPKLTPKQRDLVRIRLAGLTGEDWMDDGELAPEQQSLIEQRIQEHEQNPTAAVSWEVMEERLKARYGL
jgi:putative addiction module component (TIGR02574 family)